MTTTINASPTNGLVQTADGSGVLKVQSNGVTTNALAWVKFTGSTGGILSSYNVSSITRSGAGRYTVNFTTAMADANYVPQVSLYYSIYIPSYFTATTTSLIVHSDTTGGAPADPTSVAVSVFGN